MLTTIILSIILAALAVIMLGVRVFFTKNGEFPNTHIGGSDAMRCRGIGCATSQDREAQGTTQNPVKTILHSDL